MLEGNAHPRYLPFPRKYEWFSNTKKKEKSHPTLYLKVCVVYMFKNQSGCSRLKEKKVFSHVKLCFHLG